MATYDTLIGSTGDIAQMLENSSTELVTFMPRAVEIAEQRIYNELPALAFNATATDTLTAGQTQITRPETITTLRYLTIDGVPLKFIDFTAMKELYPTAGANGTPQWYSVDDPAYFEIRAPATGGETYVLGYRKPLTALATGASNNANWLTRNAYSLLLTASVVECARFVIDDRQGGLLQTYENKYTELLLYYTDREKRNQRDDFRPRNFVQRNDAGQSPGVQQ